MTTDLKPCPFCGCTETDEDDCSNMQTNGTRISCAKCGASVEGYGAATCTARAEAAWNTRATVRVKLPRESWQRMNYGRTEWIRVDVVLDALRAHGLEVADA